MAEAKGDRLVKSALALLTSTTTGAILGLVFWAVAAHLFKAQYVGYGAAAIAAMTGLASVAQLNLSVIFPRFLYAAGARATRVLVTGYAAAALLARGSRRLPDPHRPPPVHRPGCIRGPVLSRCRRALGRVHDRGCSSDRTPSHILGAGREHIVLRHEDPTPPGIRDPRPCLGGLPFVDGAGDRMHHPRQPLPLPESAPRPCHLVRRTGLPAAAACGRIGSERRVRRRAGLRRTERRTGTPHRGEAGRSADGLLPDSLAHRNLIRLPALRHRDIPHRRSRARPGSCRAGPAGSSPGVPHADPRVHRPPRRRATRPLVAGSRVRATRSRSLALVGPGPAVHGSERLY